MVCTQIRSTLSYFLARPLVSVQVKSFYRGSQIAHHSKFSLAFPAVCCCTLVSNVHFTFLVPCILTKCSNHFNCCSSGFFQSLIPPPDLSLLCRFSLFFLVIPITPLRNFICTACSLLVNGLHNTQLSSVCMS